MANVLLYIFVTQDSTVINTMKDKLKTSGEVIKGLIKTGGDVADKVLDKSTDVATAMMNNMTGLISKLSDDIGLMANRILTMEERIGLMADRIVKTEAVMAKLTSTLANKDFDLSSDQSLERGALQTAFLDISDTEASAISGPRLTITGDPKSYLLYVSTGPLFRDGSTVVSHINDTTDYDKVWKRSINAIRGLRKSTKNNKEKATIVAVAVKLITENNQISALSNSVDVRVYD